MDAAVRTQPEAPETGARLADPAAFRAFYEEALPRVYGYLLPRCGGDVATAEDLTQETFLAAVAELRRGASVAAPVPWVLEIARHKLVDFYRRRGREATAPLPLDAEPRLRGEPDESATDDHREVTLAALAAVPADQRTALVLRHMDGLSVPEIAAALGRSVHAVESLLARGRANFRRRYEEFSREEASCG